jgi:hypothetical protein
MANVKNWILLDVQMQRHVDSWQLSSQELGLLRVKPWTIQKKTLRGGLADGVDMIEVNNGDLSFTVLPTRGMGIWRGHYRGMYLGWRAPIVGPVNPAFVDQDDRGGLGWLAGFDEWVVRCGLNSNGPPGIDVLPDGRQVPLTLHGRIANCPAHFVEVRVNLEPPHELEVTGRVRESALFGPSLELQTTIVTTPGGNRLLIRDTIVNLRGQPSELELLYHVNFGPPLANEGTRFVAPFRMLAPGTDWAARGIDQVGIYPAPTPGVPESVYFFDLLGDPGTGQTVAALQDPTGIRACAVRFSRRQLPWFILWKHPAAMSEGYVTGLEPATNLPNFKSFERENGRVLTLPGGGSYSTDIAIELIEGRDAVNKLTNDIRILQAQAAPIVHRQPVPDFTPTTTGDRTSAGRTVVR